MILRDRSSLADADVRASLRTMMRRAAAPGVSVAVVSREQLRFSAGMGWADLAERTPATPETSYLWFSMTKIVTATAAMRLVDEGRLDLDVPVTDYVPWVRGRHHPGPTMRQLLTHTAGFANPLPLKWVHAATDPAVDQEAMLRRLLHRRGVVGRPAPRARYSNVGYLAAAQVIAAVAQVPFERFVHEAILDPVGMADTGFAYRPEGQRATGYIRAPRMLAPVLRSVVPSTVLGPRHSRHVALRPFLVDGAGYGGLVGPVLDVARLLRLHLGDGTIDGRRVLSEQSARAMRRIVARGRRFDHGIGWFRQHAREPAEYVEHFGAGAGFWNVMRIYPARGVGVAVMSNGTSPLKFRPAVAALAALVHENRLTA